MGRYLYPAVCSAAKRWPDNVAIEVNGGARTYRQLVQDAEALAGATANALEAPPQRVVLDATKSYGTYVSYLAALRMGAVVIPLSLDGPTQQAALATEISGPDLLMSGGTPPPGLCTTSAVVDPGSGGLLDVSREAHGRRRPTPPLAPGTEYVLFTSGTTGVPKGVPIGAQSLRAYVERARGAYGVTERSRMSHTFELTFDLSVFDMFVTWSSGATLCVPTRRSSTLFSRYVAEAALTHWFGVPSAISVADQLGYMSPGAAPDLRYVLVCGEPFRWKQATTVAAACPRARIFNLYGPTELTISCSDYQLPADPGEWARTRNGTVPIGAPHDFLGWCVLGEASSVTSGSGELCVRGQQRFDGYLGSASAEQCFVSGEGEPASGADATDLHYYLTGDIVEQTDNGLVHLGRHDAQVKVGGFRVELLEVETLLAELADVAEGVVFTKESNDVLQLWAAYVGHAPETRVRAELARCLPRHAVPARIVRVDSLPRSAHGKTDRRAVERLLTD